jgi:hypothetical protein
MELFLIGFIIGPEETLYNILLHISVAIGYRMDQTPFTNDA